MKFSQRIRATPIKDVLQVDSLDDDLRVGLWNVLTNTFPELSKETSFDNSTNSKIIYLQLWHHYFKYPLDKLEKWIPANYQTVRTYFFAAKWFEVYDFIEYFGLIADGIEGLNSEKQNFRNSINSILERELSGFRFVEGSLAPITSAMEMSAITTAITDATAKGLDPVSEHLRRAVELLSDKSTPDYRNSIKESISSVESAASIIAGKSKAELNSALDKISNKSPIHASLKKAISSLYGYTSDDSGIRHAMLESPTVSQADALFMLVSCSAFVNYLLSKNK